MLGWELYVLGGGQFILRPFSHFEMQYFKNLKVFTSFLIFRFSDLRSMQGFRYRETLLVNLNFLIQGAVSFHPLVDPQN